MCLLGSSYQYYNPFSMVPTIADPIAAHMFCCTHKNENAIEVVSLDVAFC